MVTAGVLWKRAHDLVVIGFAALLVVAGVLGHRERTRDDSITELFGGGHAMDDMRPGEIAIVGAILRVKDPITITAVEPLETEEGRGSVVDVREMNAGGECAGGWPMRTMYAAPVLGRPLPPGQHMLGLFLRPAGPPRWSSSGVKIRYERDGASHSQGFDSISWDLHADPDNRGCQPHPFPATGWDAPVGSDPHHVVCINAWQINHVLTHPDANWRADQDVRVPLAPLIRTIVNWAPESRDPGLRAAGAALGFVNSRGTPVRRAEVGPAVVELLAACRATGGLDPYLFAARNDPPEPGSPSSNGP